MEDALFLVGRVLFGGYFIMMGMNHFTKTQMMVKMAESKKVPKPKVAILTAGLLMIFGGVGILVGFMIYWAALALVVFLISSALIMHNFWAVSKEEKMMEMMNFMRNMALAGGALIAIRAFEIVL